MSSKSHRENVKLLDKRINDGSIDGYFDLDEDAVKELSIARSEDNFENMATIMVDNLSRNSDSFKDVVIKAYDSQIQEMADRFIDSYVTKIETQISDAFSTSNLSDIRNITAEISSFEPSSGFKLRRKQMLKQLQEAEITLSTPAEIRKIAVDLVKEKGKDPKDIRTTKLKEKWGRYGKPALVTWGRRGLMAVKYLDKKIPKLKKSKLEYTPTKKENIGRTTKQILSKKGQTFSIKERAFVKMRKNKSDDEVLNDYVRVFGDIRPKSEIKNLINIRHDPNITDLRNK